MIVRDLDDYLRHIQNNMHPAFIKNIAKEMQEKDKEIERLKEEYVMLQNASDKVEEEKDKEIERLNNDIKELLKENSNKEKVIKIQDNIIKEVRERVLNENKPLPSAREIIEILDKVGSDKE